MALLVLPFGCMGPTGNPTTLEGIRREAGELMQRPIPRSQSFIDVPIDQLPPTIAALKPDFVLVNESGVDIVTTAFFDGGWGYYVPRSANPSPNSLFRHYRVGRGVYWFHPY
ncbi:MAG TPA: hypothetical protein VFO80_12080 [Sphingomonas sp.]|nr:hypothetical protein [Sphingomonas sp.]